MVKSVITEYNCVTFKGGILCCYIIFFFLNVINLMYLQNLSYENKVRLIKHRYYARLNCSEFMDS